MKRGYCGVLFISLLLWSALVLAIVPAYAEEATPNSGLPGPLIRSRKPVETSVKLSTGFGSTFQLTLGGMFSDGVAQQNGVTVDVKNLVRENSTLRLSFWDTIDTSDRGHDWIGAVNYLQPIATWESGKLTLNLGVHKWQFPSVLNGSSDTIIDSGLILTQTGPVAFTLDANVKTLAGGPGRKGVGGQIYYLRATTAHPLVRTNRSALSIVHGPSYTYANRFYGCDGARVLRYEGGVVFQHGRFSAEAMYRPQVALQKGIPENQFWSAGVAYVLGN